MATASRRSVEVVVLLLCVAFTGVLTSCVANDGSTVEQRTRDVPLVIKGIVTSRSHTGRSIRIRIGKILKGSNESVDQNELDLVILEGQSTTTTGTTTTNGPTGNSTDIARTVASINVTTLSMNSSLTTNETMMSTEIMQSTSQAATQCMDGAGIFDRYIFFLRPIDDGGVLFEVAKDGVPQSKTNLRKVRQAVKEAQSKDDNETLELMIPDSHHAPCVNGSRWDESYCMNGGRCAYWKNLDKHFCICRYPYSGMRCGIVDPGTQTGGQPVDLNTTTLGIAAILAVLLLVVIMCGIAYIRYKNSVWRERKKAIEKAVKYLPNPYSARASSRRESPIEGVLNFKNDSSSSDGLQQVIILHEADGRISRAGSLSSNQYKLLTEVQMNGSNGDFRDQNSNRASRSSVV